MNFIHNNKPTLYLEEQKDLHEEKKCEKPCCLLFAEAVADATCTCGFVL